MKRGERRYTLFHGWCDVSYTCYQYVAGLGLELAILDTTVRLTVDCAREPGLQKCGLFLRPLGKMRMHFLNVSHLMTNPTKWPLRPAMTQISLGIRLVCSVFAVRSVGSWGPNVSSSRKRRLWSDWADAQADLSHRWAQRPFCWFDSGPATYHSLKLIMRILFFHWYKNAVVRCLTY